MFRFNDHNGNATLLWATEDFAVRFQATEGRGHATVERVADAVVAELRD